jgi:hypothetical protein
VKVERLSEWLRTSKVRGGWLNLDTHANFGIGGDSRRAVPD